MTSQWMLWHVNPDWIKDELFHWQDYQRQPQKALFSWENVYHTPYVLEWWSQQRGLDIMARIYETAENPEDPADAYMRLTGLSTEQFNDELFEAHRHTVFCFMIMRKCLLNYFVFQHIRPAKVKIYHCYIIALKV